MTAHRFPLRAVRSGGRAILKRAGVVAITDDGHCIQNNELMRRAVEYARMVGVPVLDHCQDYDLVGNGVVHEGYWSNLLGLPGWPAAGAASVSDTSRCFACARGGCASGARATARPADNRPRCG